MSNYVGDTMGVSALCEVFYGLSPSSIFEES